MYFFLGFSFMLLCNFSKCIALEAFQWNILSRIYPFFDAHENYQFRKTPKRAKKENSQAAKKNKNHEGKLPSQKGEFPSLEIIKYDNIFYLME